MTTISLSQPVTANSSAELPRVRVAVVGGGFAGLAIAIGLKRAGIEFVLFERGDELGGTWRDNHYPGCKCDVPSHLYSFSFAPNPGWRHTYSPQAEIWDYLRSVAERYQILPHVRYGHELLRASWQESEQSWLVETSRGSWRADVLVGACGALSEPKYPNIAGLESFAGRAFHSARWDHNYELRGKRVAVIGIGASAVQFVPQIQPLVERLYLFQRTPAWVFPHPDRPIREFEKQLYRRLPIAQRLVREWVYWSRELVALALTKRPQLARWLAQIARRHLARQIQDPELRRKLSPDYLPGCKRMLISNDFYPAIAAANAELIVEPIREVQPQAIVTADGRQREIDAIIFGTGFHVTDHPIAWRIYGAAGQNLAEHWSQTGARAYLGTTVPGFPNFFMMTGPNTGIGHTSLLVMIEAQARYVVECLRRMQSAKLGRCEVRPERCEAFNRELDRKLQRTVWIQGGCNSWYLDRRGRNTTIWPDFTWKYRRLLRRFEPRDYSFAEAQAAVR